MMKSASLAALSRTTRFVNAEFFGLEANEDLIGRTLWRSTVRVIADLPSAASVQGQLLITTLVNLVTRMGVAVSLSVPDVELVKSLPLAGPGGLSQAAGWLAHRIMPEDRLVGRMSIEDVLVVIGPLEPRNHAVWLSAEDWSARVSPHPMPPGLSGQLPWGVMAGAAMGAAAVLRRLLPKIAATCGVPYYDPPLKTAVVDLKELLTAPIPGAAALRLPPIDFVSAGAISNACIYALRAADTRFDARVFDDDITDVSNLNRNVLMTVADVGTSKAIALASQANGAVIKPVGSRITSETRSEMGTLRDFVLVGADDVLARWEVQKRFPDFIAIGATQGQFVLVSTHSAATNCAGCVHSVRNQIDEVVPTISFVSFWAGLLQALSLLAEVGGSPLAGSALQCWPVGNEGPGISCFHPVLNSDCPLGCQSGAA